MAVPPEEAERSCRRALMEARVGRESAVFKLPPSRLALDPCDVILLDHDGRLTELRLVTIADSNLRGIEAVRQDRAVYDLPPRDARPASLSSPVVLEAPDVLLLDLPQLSEDQPAHRPFVAAHAAPWPGVMAVFRSAATDGLAVLTTFGDRSRMGVLAADFHAGPTSRFDLGNALVVDLFSGTLESVTDITLLGDANALAVESSPGQWEILQAGSAELIAPGRYRLTRLLRGQRGTENAVANLVAIGARVVVLDSAVTPLADQRGRSRSAMELARGTGVVYRQRRNLRRRHFYARRCGVTALFGRPCRTTVAHGAQPRRFDHPLDTPVAIPRRQHLGHRRCAIGGRQRSL